MLCISEIAKKSRIRIKVESLIPSQHLGSSRYFILHHQRDPSSTCIALIHHSTKLSFLEPRRQVPSKKSSIACDHYPSYRPTMLWTPRKEDSSRGAQGLGGMLGRGINLMATYFGGLYKERRKKRRLRCGISKLGYLRWESLNMDRNLIRFEQAIWVKLSIRIVAPTI